MAAPNIAGISIFADFRASSVTTCSLTITGSFFLTSTFYSFTTTSFLGGSDDLFAAPKTPGIYILLSRLTSFFTSNAPPPNFPGISILEVLGLTAGLFCCF